MSPPPRPRPPDNASRTIKREVGGDREFLYWDQLDIDTIVDAIEGADLSHNLAAVESAINLINDHNGSLPAQAYLHEYQENVAVPSGAETTILSYTVPVGKELGITRWRAWADVDAEYFLRVDSVQKGGHRTSIAYPTVDVDMGIAALVATAGQIVTIRCYRQSPSLLLTFKAQLMGVLTDV